MSDDSSDKLVTSASGHVIILTVAGDDDRPLLENLMNLYVYDFSEYTGDDPDASGRFADEHLPLYWTEHGRAVEGRVPYLVRIDGQPAGFVLAKKPHSTEFGTDLDIAEFFILRKWRRIGAGGAVASAIFSAYPGRWEVRVMRENTPALGFWRRVISQYTAGRFEEIDSRSEHWDGTVFLFVSGA